VSGRERQWSVESRETTVHCAGLDRLESDQSGISPVVVTVVVSV